MSAGGATGAMSAGGATGGAAAGALGAASVAMPWVGLGVAVLGTALSLSEGRKAAREQKALQERALRQQQEQLDFTRNAYNEEKGFINPIREDLRREYFTDTANSPAFARAKAEIEGGVGRALQENTQNMEAQGMTGSAADNSTRVATLLRRASMLGDARLRGEISKADLGFKILGTDKTMPLLGAMSGANQGVAGTFQNMSNAAGDEKNAWNQAAGKLAGAGLQAALTYRPRQAPQPQATTRGATISEAPGFMLNQTPQPQPQVQVQSSVYDPLNAVVPGPVSDRDNGWFDFGTGFRPAPQFG